MGVSKNLLLATCFATIAIVAFMPRKAFADDNNKVCYHTDEILAEVTLNFMLAQGAAAVQCDDLLITRDYENLHVEIFKKHSETFESFLKPTKTLLVRYQVDDKDYLFTQFQKVQEFVLQSQMSEEDCKLLYQEMLKRKANWKHIINPIIVEISLLEDSDYPKCKVEMSYQAD